ncbi:hypothetical protein C473_06950 [Halorubrum distributum JCM 10247]|uniref:Uncharacterized protein n=1 Tax=Halorubrum distributum JCM 10247 TaxID=1227486 RepID=M0DE66_9EURY|nr:hypothetical protein C473_06950 [Halorubrum terrestre JCM 10247]
MGKPIPIVNSRCEIARDNFTKLTRIKLGLCKRPRLLLSVTRKERDKRVFSLWVVREKLTCSGGRFLRRGHWCSTVRAPD